MHSVIEVLLPPLTTVEGGKLSNERIDALVIDTLTAFNRRNAGSSSFIDKSDEEQVEQKHQLIQQLLTRYIHAPSDIPHPLQCFEVSANFLRLMCREPVSIEPMLTWETLSSLANLCGLTESSSSLHETLLSQSSSSSSSPSSLLPLRTECLKCLVNVLHQTREFWARFCSIPSLVSSLTQWLSSSSAEDYMTLFLLSRVAFYLSCEPENSSLLKSHKIDFILCSKLNDTFALNLSAPLNDPTVDNFCTAALTALYNLTMFANEPEEQERMISLYDSVDRSLRGTLSSLVHAIVLSRGQLTRSSSTNPYGVHTLVGHTVNVLMNAPLKYIEESIGNDPMSLLSLICLTSVYLPHEMQNSLEFGEKLHLIPPLSILQKVVKENKLARAILSSWIMDDEWTISDALPLESTTIIVDFIHGQVAACFSDDAAESSGEAAASSSSSPSLQEPEQEDKKQALKEPLKRLLMTPKDGLRTYVSEFMFSLCGEDAGEFVRQVEFGNAAGLLYHKGLLANNAQQGGAADAHHMREYDDEAAPGRSA